MKNDCLRFIAGCLCFLLLLTACGQTGKLYLPEQQPNHVQDAR